MEWTTAADIKRQLQRCWSSGRLLAAPLRGENLFPLSLAVRRPDPKSLSERFDDVRNWIKELENASRSTRGFGYEIEWMEINHRLLGRNRVPVRIVVPAENDALKLINMEREAGRFRFLLAETRKSCPELVGWIARKPIVAIENAGDWEGVLAVLNWFRSHPRCGLYIRELDIPGVDTKFIETRRGLISELLDEMLPQEAIDWQARGAGAFEQRYGLKSKPPLIRLRLLDSRLYILGLSDLTVPMDECTRLNLPVKRVFVTENEINGLAFPSVPDSLIIFGLGYRVERLAAIGWLRYQPLHYWGDIDTHGFAILDRVRAAFPHVESFLMDRETLLNHRRLWVHEQEYHDRELSHLTPSEKTLYDDLRYCRLGENLRLEQERIPYGWLMRALRTVLT